MGKKQKTCSAPPTRRRKRRRSSDGGGEEYGKEECGEDTSPMGLLADDIVLQLLSSFGTRYVLSIISLVCRRWRRLSQYLVTELVPSPIIGYWDNMKWGKLVEIAEKHACTIRRLDLGPLFSYKELGSLISLLPHLEELSAECYHPNTDSKQQQFESMVQHLPRQLQRLFLNSETGVVELLRQQCPGLRAVGLMGCTAIDARSLNTAFPALTSIDLSSDLVGWPEVGHILEHCSGLLHLSLLSPLLHDVPQQHYQLPASLVSLRLYHAPEQTARLAWVLAHAQLQELHAQNSFIVDWQHISASFTCLKVLDLSASTFLVTHQSDRVTLTKMEEDALCHLTSVLANIEKLALFSATDRILVLLGRCCSKLRELRLGWNNRRAYPVHPITVTDRGVRSLVEGCANLEVLCLQSCVNITAGALRAIAFHCERLRVLYLRSCRQLDDSAVFALFPRLCRSLKLLDLFGCLRLTKRSLEHIKDHAGSGLRFVFISPSLARPFSYKQLNVKHGQSCNWYGFYRAPDLAAVL